MSEKVLTKEIAEQFIANEEFEEMSEFTSLDVDAALILIYHEHGLEEWSEFSFGIYLNGLLEVSDDLAEVLKTYSGQAHHGEECYLDLSSVIKISENAIKSLSEFNGDEIILSSLECLSDESCSDLSYYRGSLILDGFRSPTINSIESLSRHAGDSLSLSGLKEITVEMADLLSRYRGHLCLEGLEEISDDVATKLSKTRGNLTIGLRRINDSVAVALAKHEGFLYLNNLTAVDNSVADRLCIHPNLFVDVGFWSELTSLTLEAAQTASRHEGELILNNISKLSDEAAIELSKHQGKLHLNGLCELSDISAKSLSLHDGEIYLDNLKNLSETAANHLSLLLDDSIAKSPKEKKLARCILISDSAAQILAKTQNHCPLNGLVSLTESAAEALSGIPKRLAEKYLSYPESNPGYSKAKGGWLGSLELDGLTTLSENTASIISSFGSLSLNGLKELSVELAIALSKPKLHKEGFCCLKLYGLTDVSDSTAKELAKYPAENICWNDGKKPDSELTDDRGDVRPSYLEFSSSALMEKVKKYRQC
ncbi:hypothetical protein OAO16_03715 [Opitutales bacterium]|nr:hypothetical protein [Opitutales bacterium]